MYENNQIQQTIIFLNNQTDNVYKMLVHYDDSRFKMLRYYFSLLAGIIGVFGWLYTKSSLDKNPEIIFYIEISFLALGLVMGIFILLFHMFTRKKNVENFNVLGEIRKKGFNVLSEQTNEETPSIRTNNFSWFRNELPYCTFPGTDFTICLVICLLNSGVLTCTLRLWANITSYILGFILFLCSFFTQIFGYYWYLSHLDQKTKIERIKREEREDNKEKANKTNYRYLFGKHVIFCLLTSSFFSFLLIAMLYAFKILKMLFVFGMKESWNYLSVFIPIFLTISLWYWLYLKRLIKQQVKN